MNLVVPGCVAALHGSCVVPTDGSRFLPSSWVALLCEIVGLFRAVALRRLHSGPPGFLGRCPFHAPSGRVGSARTCEVVYAVGFRFLAFRAVMAKSKCPCSLMPFASWLPEALRCHGAFGAWCSDAGFLLVSLPPLPSVTSLRPGITPACSRRPCLFDGWWPVGIRGCASIVRLPPVVASWWLFPFWLWRPRLKQNVSQTNVPPTSMELHRYRQRIL